MKDIPMLSDAPAAERAREGAALEETREFGQASGLEVSRRPPRRLAALCIAFVSVLTTSVSSYIFTDPQMPRIDPVIEFPWFMPIGPYFASIWLALMLSAIVSFYLILRSSPDNRLRRKAIAAYVAQFVLHTAWAWLLFPDRNPALALWAAAALAPSVAITVWITAQIDKRASILLTPSLAWALFALISTLRIAGRINL